MSAPRRSVEISVERELSGEDPDRPTRVRLSTTLEPRADGPEITSEEIRSAVAKLRKDLDESVGSSGGPARPDRALPELIQTYRPRQTELVELLHEEGELSDGEHALLRQYVEQSRGTAVPLPSPASSGEPAAASAAPVPPPAFRPLAAAPLAAESAPTTPRPVPELLARFQIGSLKQAGAVRARRQISFEEYMALKRHFEHPSSGSDRAVAPSQ